MAYHRLILCILWVLPVVPGCRSEPSTPSTEQIEIAPDRWITIQRVDNTYEYPASRATWNHYAPHIPRGKQWTWFSVPVDQRVVTWVGVDLPISLRDWESTLFMITIDSESNQNEAVLRYYKERDGGFAEIKPGDFPRRIATQNMWLKTDAWITMMGGSRVRPLDVTRNLNIEHGLFGDTYTARVWWHLERGANLKQQPYAWEVPTEFLREYVAKYQPIALPTIVREDTEKQNPDK